VTYNPNIPQSNERPSVSQSKILTNFQQLNTVFDEDHLTFNASENNGKHKAIHLREVSDPTTISNELGLYVKETDSISELWLRRESNGTKIQLTSKNPTKATAGQTFLPGGIILKWGNSSVGAGGDISFPTQFPTACLNVQATVEDSSAIYVSVKNISKTKFTTTLSRSANSVRWLAIGY
jgi:hypothetical protein